MKSPVMPEIVFPYSTFEWFSVPENMKLKGVYVIWHKCCYERIYIGSARKSFRHRWSCHLGQLRRGEHHSKKLQRVVDKYGIDGLVFQIIHLCDRDECLDVEQLYIDDLSPYYNSNKKTTEPHRFTKKDCEKGRSSLKKNYYGKKRGPHKESTKRLMSAVKKKVPVYKYNLFGVFVCEYISISEAGRQNKKTNSQLIHKCLTGQRLVTGGFIWLKERDDNSAKDIAIKHRKLKFHQNQKRVCIIDLSENKKHSFCSLRKASDFLGVNSSFICCAIKNKKGLYLCYKIYYE